MTLPFLNRREELARLRKLVARREGSLAVLYGRRRCGKSRLLREVLAGGRSVYYVADDRENSLQRASLAAEVASRIAGFDRVTYPDWDALFTRWWNEARPGTVLALDEFPALVSVAREVPSILQKHIDRYAGRRVHLILAGSSQRMMQGLVLDRSAPLFGRATEILKISPLPAAWIGKALELSDPAQSVAAYAAWGGVPRYWELARDHRDLTSALRELVLSPLGPLHEEPSRLLLDDLRETTQAASILSLIGQGAHRASEIAARMGKPITSLSRPLQRLVELGLVQRLVPFGESPRSSKRTLYQISDPFLRFWFRFVEPNRSRLEARRVSAVATEVGRSFSQHVAEIWKELARASVPRLRVGGQSWGVASRWWGTGLDRTPLEIDIVAESEDGRSLLLGEAKWTEKSDAPRLLERLKRSAEKFPFLEGRNVILALWLKREWRAPRGVKVFFPRQVLGLLR